ncbi:MAG: AAA family ATPase [Victivallales bacterium]|nr:AAA family ATPase [Victivallales bacterium]
MSQYIVRGLPGAGKSTFAREFAKKLGCIHIEPDMFCHQDGAYVYTEDRYRQAMALAMRLLYQIGNNGLRPDVVFADVCPTIADINAVESAYCERAAKIYTLEIDLETAIRRNQHGVSEKDLRAMAASFQDIPRQEILDTMDELIYEPIDQ